MDVVEHIRSLYDIKVVDTKRGDNVSYMMTESYFMNITEADILIKIDADENFKHQFMNERFILPLEITIFPVQVDKSYYISLRNVFHISWFEHVMKKIKKYVLLGKCKNYGIFMRADTLIGMALNVIIPSPIHKHMTFQSSCIRFTQDDIDDFKLTIKKGAKNRTLYKSLINN